MTPPRLPRCTPDRRCKWCRHATYCAPIHAIAYRHIAEARHRLHGYDPDPEVTPCPDPS